MMNVAEGMGVDTLLSSLLFSSPSILDHILIPLSNSSSSLSPSATLFLSLSLANELSQSISNSRVNTLSVSLSVCLSLYSLSISRYATAYHLTLPPPRLTCVLAVHLHQPPGSQLQK